MSGEEGALVSEGLLMPLVGGGSGVWVMGLLALGGKGFCCRGGGGLVSVVWAKGVLVAEARFCPLVHGSVSENTPFGTPVVREEGTMSAGDLNKGLTRGTRCGPRYVSGSASGSVRSHQC